MKNNDDLIFRRKFIKLISIFNDKPYMFIDFLMKNGAISSTFKKRLLKACIKDKTKINFIDISKMIDYYDNLIIDNYVNKIPAHIYWNNKLNILVEEQKYEEAATIKDYMITKGYEIKIDEK